MIFTPLYEQYGELFFDWVTQEYDLNTFFNSFRDTGIIERYMTNTLQFSAAKSYSEAKLLQDAVFKEGKLLPYKQFEKAAQEITDISQKTWLRVEYENAKRTAAAGSKFASMQEKADLYPYWVYKGRMDSRERPEHVDMEGKVFRIGDPAGDACFPPNDWNCRCVGEPVDGRYLDENQVQATQGAEAQKLLEDNVDEQFRFNPAVQGPMPNDHSYFDNFRSANAGDAGMFGLGMPGDDESLIGLDSALSMRRMMETVHGWRDKYHVDNKHNIVFQNKATFANVRLSDATITRIGKHSRGFENIPAAIEHPDEIWMGWEDENDQRVVLRNYILFGKICYLVKTRDGHVTDAFAVSRRTINKYRNGVIKK